MGALVDYESDGQSRNGYSASNSPDETPEQPQLSPDVDTIIQETRAEMEQARLKADQLICQFAESYVDTAGRLRDASIQRYRERLEGLPAEACAKVCETLAKDDIFCCNMDFGNGHLSYGGMSFTYKIESDAAFNALSHHAWKDLHQLFIKNQSTPLSGNGLEQGQPCVVHLAQPDDDEDGLEPHQDIPPSSSEESDSSSDEEDFAPIADSDGDFGGRQGEEPRSSVSISPEWTTDEETGNLGTPKRRGVGRPSKHHVAPDGPEKRGPGRPKSKPWSAEEETLVREKMATQLKTQGDLILRLQTCMELLQVFPGRTKAAVKNKWLDLKMKDSREDLEERDRKAGAPEAKAKAKKNHGQDTGSWIKSDADDGDELEDAEVSRGPRNLSSWVSNTWTPEQDKLLSDRMKSEMQSAGVTSMKVPPALQEELASLFGRKTTAICRRWRFLAGGCWNGREKRKRENRKKDPVPSVDSENDDETKFDSPEVDRGSHEFVTQKKLVWTPERDRLLVKKMKSELKSAGVATMPVPPALQRELGKLFSVHEKTISRRWRLISETFTSSGSGQMKRKDESELPRTPGKGEGKAEGIAPASSPQLQVSDDPGDSEGAEASGSRRKSSPNKVSTWSAQEVEALTRLTKDLKSSGDIDFEEVAAQLPSPMTRTAKACKVYWHKHLQSSRGDHDRNQTPAQTADQQIVDEQTVDKQTGDKRSNKWSRDEDDHLWRLAQSGITWRDVAAQMPRRTLSACQVRYTAHLANKPEYKERLNGQPGRIIHRRGNPKRDPESDQESAEEAETVVWGARGSKHERESDDEGKKRSATRRKKHRGALEQSFPGRRDRNNGSEVEDSDEFE
ncbi:hypothetical protein DHEL01_v202317 [Diaporthe helianthi]|uniref:Myb-like domain-containing protein n=1 Tax=Diaporthe helianthi TaxID=158607 RepID=A0A2P5I9V3_DIAHE|nr:hypothetical protein DHEL01_v202317 [Diaporthe helianthi]